MEKCGKGTFQVWGGKDERFSGGRDVQRSKAIGAGCAPIWLLNRLFPFPKTEPPSQAQEAVP
ncbi:MAG: hypothetical protein LBH75_07145 [Treponema sp.]|nr:hypothetical protein [Treponema sp.]